MEKKDGVYIRINGEEKFITKPPANGFGQTTVSWANGKPTTAENKETIKLNK
ncbi:DUF3954 domain-containing protein [Listeria weihenstephanensis]|uniref:DUF3954 domain-containing protein n=2 Tax=Listeria TaxID=1637 RepID=A0A7X0XBZ0_9LIST|nr:MULTISPECIES: DUF3954 domain-containing protein [Listeria]MBC1491409.1 DUF3954 domain-containing protein [Listeria booriae]MBC1499387.1 DUF3954 domain-containing protein [Listeria weihenstephanensis]